MSTYSKRLTIIFSLWTILFVSVIVILVISLRRNTSDTLTVAFLDVGQGDAIYIEAPNRVQMLIDGGADTEVLSRLSRVVPFFDRTLDVVLATHTDKDHIGGLPGVLQRFNVASIVESGTVSDTMLYDTWNAYVANEGSRHVIARTGMRIVLDDAHGIYADILFPDRDVSRWDPNDGSVIVKLVYGEQSFLLTGDAPEHVETYLMYQQGIDVDVDVLKLGHHGSNTSSSARFLEAVSPEYAIVLAGCDNRYGHPHKEVIARVEAAGIEHFGTCEKGTIVFTTDGKDMKVRFRK